MRAISRTIILTVTFLIASGALLATTPVNSAEEKPLPQVLFTNVNIFDGNSDSLAEGMSVLVEGNLIKQVKKGDIKTNRLTRVIDGGGRTLMPGLIESHVHLNLQHMVGGYETMENRDWQEIGAMAAFAAQSLLMDGFTTARDLGTLQAGIKNAIDRGDAIGPRIYTAVGVIGQTSGHGDWRAKGFRTLASRDTYKAGQLGMTYIVDGSDAWLSAARQNLANGAAFNKMTISGGVFSTKDPLHTSQGTTEEIAAVVGASAAWDTYATAHIFNVADARRAIDIGLKAIEHIVFIDVETAQIMAEKGIFYGPQLSTSKLEVIEATFGPGESVNKSKALVVSKAVDNVPVVLRQVPRLLERTVFGPDIVTATPANAIRTRDHEM